MAVLAASGGSWCNAQQWMTSRISQGLFWILTLGHCSVYMLGPSSFETFTSFVLFVWFTGAPLAVMTILEVCIRVSVQAGPIWRFKSWRWMMIPLYHQLEAFVMAVMAFRGGMSIYLLLLALLGGESPTSVQDQDKATVLVLCGYRALRTWGDLHGVSVQSTLRWRRRQARKQKVWMNEYKRQLQEHRQLFFVRMQRCFDHRLSQLTLLWATILYCFMEFQDSFPIASEIFGYILLGAFFCEFIARAKAQGGERFFRPMCNKLEFFVLIAGTWCLFYASWYTDLLAESKDDRATLAAATVFLLLLHRCIRLLAIRFQVSGSQFHANTLMSAKAMEIFMAKFGNLVEVPPTNIHVDVPGSMIHIEKATLKPEAFRDLHLPVTFSGGLIEDLFIDFFTHESATYTGAFARVGRGQPHARTKVRIRNLLLVLSPGRGLAEAGGSHGSYWKAGNLQEGKARVVDLICRRLSAPFPDKMRRSMSKETVTSRGSDSNTSPTWSHPRGLGRFAQMQWKLRVVLNSGMRRFKNLIQDSTLRHLDLDIQNASLQFEDSSGALGHGSLNMGMKMDSLKLMRDAGQSMTLQLARLSFYVEPFGSEESWQKKSVTEEKPQYVVRKMVRLNNADRLRSWAFAELGKGLNATERLHQLERWPERHNVLMIPWVSLHAGPQGMEEESTIEEELPAGESQSRGNFGRTFRERVQQVATRVTRVRISSDLEDQLFGSQEEEEETMRWHWKLQVRPLTVMVDDVQLGCVRHLHHCIRSWLSCDAAFRWRPDLTPLDPMVTPRERRAVIRCWWYYALYRILAKRTRRMPLKFLDLVLKAGYRFKYRSLLSVVVGRSGPLIPGGRVFLKPSPQQLKQMQELQMHLAYPDIISCYRAVLATAVGQGATTLRAVQEAHQEVIDAAEVQELELESAAEDEMERLESPEDTASTSSSDSEEPSASGTWELRWSGLEVWVPFWRPGRGYRPVFLHVNFQELAIDAEVLEKDDTDSKLAPFSLLCSLKGFTFSSPECGKANAAVTDVVKITHPVSMASSLFNSFFHLGPVDRTCIGEPFALILQARATSGKEVSAVVHCPELKVMFWEPLILTLRAFVTQSAHRFMNDDDCATLSVLHGGNITRKDGKVSARNGRIGPTSISATFETDQESSDSEKMMKSQASAANQQTKLTQRLQAAQRLFERCVLIHEDIGIDLSFNLRPIQIFQVGQYTKDQLGIEEARIPPQHVSANALRSDDPASVAFERSRTGTLWAESGSKMCFISAGPPFPEAHGAGGAEDYMNERHSRLTDLAESMSPSWVARSELLPSFQGQDESEGPGVQNASVLGVSWRPFWMFCCCKNDVDQDKHSTAARVSGLGIRSGPDYALGKALAHLAFWKLGPDEFSVEWIKKQEAEWHRKVSLGRGRPLSL